MKSDAFKNLPDEKQKAILNVCIEEFAEHGFVNTSTNHIVRRIGISKGSLFQYFGTKENLYKYVLEIAIGGLLRQLKERSTDLPGDVLERVKKIGEITIDIYGNQPQIFNLFLNLFEKKAFSFHDELVSKFSKELEELILDLSRGIDIQNLRWGIETTIDMIKWVLNGIKTDLMMETGAKPDIEKFKKKYLEKLNVSLQVLSEGIYK